MRRRIDERHKRETRRTRIDLLLEGVTAIETVYRDVLAAPAPALNRDRPALAVTPRAAAAALDACREAREAFLINEKGAGAPRRAADGAPTGADRLSRRYTLCSFAGVAQSVEQLTRNEQVRGSNPLSGSTAFAGGSRRVAPVSNTPEPSIARSSPRAGEEVVLDRRGRGAIRVRRDLCVHREREPRVGVTETVLGGADVDS